MKGSCVRKELSPHRMSTHPEREPGELPGWLPLQLMGLCTPRQLPYEALCLCEDALVPGETNLPGKGGSAFLCLCPHHLLSQGCRWDAPSFSPLAQCWELLDLASRYPLCPPHTHWPERLPVQAALSWAECLHGVSKATPRPSDCRRAEQPLELRPGTVARSSLSVPSLSRPGSQAGKYFQHCGFNASVAPEPLPLFYD